MAAPGNQQITPVAALGPILLCIIFGANSVAIKISLAGVGAFTMAGLRFALAAAIIAIWARMNGHRFAVGRSEIGPLMIVSLLFTIQLSLFYVGLSRTLASRGVLVANAVPFFVLIFAHFFIPDDRINLRKICGMVLGFGGVAMVLVHKGGLGTGLYSGDGIIFTAAVIWAGNAVYTKTIIHRFRPFQLVLYPMLCAAPIQLAVGWLWDDGMIQYMDGSILMAIIYQSVICAAFGFVAWNTLLQRYGASTLHSFVFIMPIAGVAAGGLILNEPITPVLIAAVVMIAVGIGLVNLHFKRTTTPYPVGRSF